MEVRSVREREFGGWWIQIKFDGPTCAAALLYPQ